jgi:hypothetical protein
LRLGANNAVARRHDAGHAGDAFTRHTGNTLAVAGHAIRAGVAAALMIAAGVGTSFARSS